MRVLASAVASVFLAVGAWAGEGETPPLEPGWSEVPLSDSGRSIDILVGSPIRTPDQKKVATVDEVLTDAVGDVDGIVARFGGFLGFGESTFTLGAGEFRAVEDGNQNIVVLTGVSAEMLKSRPAYRPAES